MSIVHKKILPFVQKIALFAKPKTRRFGGFFFDKKLITNNKNIQNRGYYDPQKIFCYEKIEELDPAFVNSGTDITYDDKFREQFKPYNMLNFIDKYLSEMN